MLAKKCTKKRDARAKFLFCLSNLLLFWSSRCRRRRGILRSLLLDTQRGPLWRRENWWLGKLFNGMFLMITVNVLTLFCSHFVLYFSITLSFFSSCSLKVCFHSSECWESARIAIVFLKTLNSCLLYGSITKVPFLSPLARKLFTWITCILQMWNWDTRFVMFIISGELLQSTIICSFIIRKCKRVFEA